MNLFLIMLLAIPFGTADAKEWKAKSCVSKPGELVCQMEDLLPVNGEDVSSSCLAKMEAAMRAMDAIAGHGNVTFLITPAHATQAVIKLNTKLYDQVMDQWDDVKQECWRKR